MSQARNRYARPSRAVLPRKRPRGALSRVLASQWADRLLGITEMALSPDKSLRGHFHGTRACLTALYRAERFDEIIALVPLDAIWSYMRWVAKALAATGRKAEASSACERSVASSSAPLSFRRMTNDDDDDAFSNWRRRPQAAPPRRGFLVSARERPSDAAVGTHGIGGAGAR